MSFNIPSFPDLPSIPALPTLPNTLPPGLPTGSFSDMINAAAMHIGMNDAVQQAQAQIQSVTQLQSFGVAMPPNVMDLAHSALESAANFNPTSMFKNPAESQLADLSKITSAVTSSLTSALSTVPAAAVDSIKDIASSVASMTRFPAQAKADICTRISSLSTDIPILITARNLHNQASVLNAASTGTSSSDVTTTLINNAFPSGDSQCSGLNLDTVFKPVTQAESHFTDGLSAVSTGVTSAFGEITGTITDTAGNVLSGVDALAQHVTNSIQSAVSSIASAAADAIDGLVSNLKSQVTSLASSFTPMIDGFKQMIQDAKDTVKQAINMVKSLSLINLLTHTDPCVKGVMATVIQPNAVDPVAVSQLTKPKSEQIEIPVQTGIERAKANLPAPDIPVQTRPVPAPSLDIPNPYTKDELAALKKMVDEKFDEQETLRKQLAQKSADNDQWAQSVNMDQKRIAANIDTKLTRRDPGFGVGRSPDPTVNAAWKEVFDQYQVKRSEYEAIRQQIDTVNTLANRMGGEYELRSIWGKTPYTTRKQLKGIDTPPGAQTTFLDSGK